jgi:hypothetical protein
MAKVMGQPPEHLRHWKQADNGTGKACARFSGRAEPGSGRGIDAANITKSRLPQAFKLPISFKLYRNIAAKETGRAADPG